MPTTKAGTRTKKKITDVTNVVWPKDVMLNPSITTANLKKKQPMLLQDISIRTIKHHPQNDLHLPSRCADKNPLLTDCDNLQFDLDTVYDWESSNNLFLAHLKKTSFSVNGAAYKSNAYIDQSMNIISPSTHVLNLDISMSSNCTFDLHITNLYRGCSNLAGWILRTFTMRDHHLMLTLFKSLVLSMLDYASQLWSPYLLKYIYLIEKVQRAFTKHMTGMHDFSYSKRLETLKLY